MKTYNTYPYFDDFDESKNYHQVMFKPEYPVQARELTQAQTILRNQIEKFGNHVFQNGSIVIPGNSFTDIGVPLFSFIPTDTTIDYTKYEGAMITGAGSTIKAKVKKVVMPTQDDENCYFLINYMSGTSTTIKSYSPSETIILDPDLNITVEDLNTGSIAYVNDGVFYINGTFVSVPKQSTVVSLTPEPLSCHIVLRVEETIITHYEDRELLDNARGFNNYSAPGADRVQIQLVLTSLPLGTSFDTKDYIELMRYNKGNLEVHIRNSRYSELERNLARRTYDESGNYIVSGFDINIREHKRTIGNNGLFEDGESNLGVVEISAGKAYIKGYETEQISSLAFTFDKGRSTDHIITKDDVSLVAEYGQFIYLTDLDFIPDIKTRPFINLVNGNFLTPDSPGESSEIIGTAKILGIQKHLNIDTDPKKSIYKVIISNVSVIDNYSYQDIGYIQLQSNNTYIGTVVHKLSLTTVSGSLGNSIPETYTLIKSYTSVANEAVIRLWIPDQQHLYVYKKDSLTKIPSINENIYNPTTNGQAQIKKVDSIVSSETTSKEYHIPIFKLPFDNINSIKNSSGLYNIEYTIQDTITITTNSSGNGISSQISNGKVVPISQDADFIVISSNINYTSEDSNIISYDEANKYFRITNGNPNTTFTVVYSLVKTLSPKTKTKTSGTFTQTFGNQYSGELFLTPYTDVYEITSVTHSVDGVLNVNDFILNTGQTPYEYSYGKVTPIKPINPGTITIKYNYFVHGAGDFFSVDSYQTLGADFYSKVPSFTYNRQTIDLRQCLDFRPSVGSSSQLPKNQSRITTSVKVFVPRIDVISLEKSGQINIIRGIPSEYPIEPVIGADSIFLASLYIPPYTDSIKDVRVKKSKNNVYTMEKISKLEDRILKIEENMLLTELETSIINREIIDATTGLSRFKSGYLVENFTDPMIVGDFYNEDFSATYVDGFLRPAMERIECPFNIVSSTAKMHPEGHITLPYQEVVWINQSSSSRVTNLNPFNIVLYVGDLDISPSFDNSVDTVKVTQKKEAAVISIPYTWVKWNIASQSEGVVELPPRFSGSVSGWEVNDIVDYLESIGKIDAPTGWKASDVILKAK